MIKFVTRLKMSQLQKFFDDAGHICDIQKSYHEGMLDVIFMNDLGKTFWYSIADNYISAPDFYKTSEDWKFYMKELFGEEYFKEYEETPVQNSFVSKLSLDDVRELLETKNMKVEKIKECEAFREGTRRFKVIYSLPSHSEQEVIIGPHIEYCSGFFGITENMFMKFFTKKFGLDFITFYSNVEKRNCSEKVKQYQQKCERKLQEKRDYMVSLWQNS